MATEALEPDHENNPFNEADQLIFVGEEGWHQEHERVPFDFLRDGARWEVHYDVGTGAGEIDEKSAELMESVWSDYEWCLALNEGSVVGGGWVDAVDFIQYEDEEQDTLSLGVEDSLVHSAETHVEV